jgi:mannose-1-phosphate guanylyltransferase/phosphomannomutase
VPRSLERKIETNLRRGEFHRCNGENCKEIANMRSIHTIYIREMLKQAPEGLEGLHSRVHTASPNPRVKTTLEDALGRLGCESAEDGLLLELNDAGTSLQATAGGKVYGDEQLLAICCQQEVQAGCDLALPYNAPEMLDTLASQAGQSTLRYLHTPADQSDSPARRLSAKQIWVRDGLFRAVKLLHIIKSTGKSLAELSAELPDFYVEKKSFALPCSPAHLQELLRRSDTQLDAASEGVILRKHGGRILITPGKSGKRAQVFAEANTMELAHELCEDVALLLQNNQ